MAMTLHLGVIDIPYATESITTGEVAQILEDEYHVMEIFFDKNSDFIAKSLENGLAGALENLMMGAPVGDPFKGGTEEIEQRFRDFIFNEETGITTKTKAQGSRFKMQYKKASEKKTTFVETHNYVNSFKSWVK